MSDVFTIRDIPYNFRNFQALYSWMEKTIKFRTEMIVYRRPQIWNLLSESLKQQFLSNYSKEVIKNGKVKRAHVEYAKPILRKWDLNE